MTRPLSVLLTLAVAAAPSFAHAVDPEVEAAEERAFKRAVAVAAPSVVRIQTVAGLDRVGQVLAGTGPTTGVVVSEDGYVVSSSFNFANKPASILVELPDGRRLAAKQVATDSLKMLTLLKVDANGLKPIAAVPVKEIEVGQWSIAMGRTYPGPLPNVSTGIVSALGRIWGKAIQTDAKISPTNYGGPLVAIDGRALGLLVPLSPKAGGEVAGVEWYDSGIGFAIPMEQVYEAFARLKDGTDLKPGLMGVGLRGRGLLAGTPVVDRVRAGSPAERAGVKTGDVIQSMDGQPVARQAEVRSVLGRKYAGDEITLLLKRGDEEVEATFELVGELTAWEAGYLGVLPARPAIDADEEKGVAVRHVFAESPAAAAGLATRDVIVGVDDEEVADVEALRELVGRYLPKQSLELHYLRDGEKKSATIELAAQPDDVPAELRTWAVPPAEEGDYETGRFNERMEAHGHDFWAYVPSSYNGEHAHGLMVWLHPNGDTMEAAVLDEWKTICDRRNIVLVGPKAAKLAGWEENEAEFVRDVVDRMVEEYSIDTSRVFLHGYEEGGTFALRVAFKYPETFRGVAVVGAPIKSAPKDNSPENPLRFYFSAGSKDPQIGPIRQTITLLKQKKFPVVSRFVEDREREYPAREELGEIARWADMLDRI